MKTDDWDEVDDDEEEDWDYEDDEDEENNAEYWLECRKRIDVLIEQNREIMNALRGIVKKLKQDKQC